VNPNIFRPSTRANALIHASLHAVVAVAIGLGAACDKDTMADADDEVSSTGPNGSHADDDSTPTGATSTGEESNGSASSTEIPTEKFSFFVTSMRALQELSGSKDGFGGDLRFGETGVGAGLRGADKICATIAEKSMPGAGRKTWRAFLSAVAGEDGQPVHAIDRIGEGPWYDRTGRLLAPTKADLLAGDRPTNGDPTIADDFPNENGIPNHQPDPTTDPVDNHDFLTGTNDKGQLYGEKATCADWTGNTGTEGRPRVGHSWPRKGPPPHFAQPAAAEAANSDFTGPGMDWNMANWMSSLDESGCAPGGSVIEMGPPDETKNTVGSGGGYGGFYCFALQP
jgi:hypothetical protein